MEYSHPSDRRHHEKIDLPELEGRGALGGGSTGCGERSRTLIQKGQLRSLQTLSDAGHLLRIVDEAGKAVPTARALLASESLSLTTTDK